MSEREYVDEVYLYRTKLREIPVSTVKNYIERKALEEYQQLYRELDEAQEEFAKLQTRIKELHTDRNTQRIVVEHYIEMAQYKERTIAAYKQRLLQYEEKKELKDIYFRATHPNQPIERNNTNGKLRTVMLITLIIGIIATVFFVILFDIDFGNAENCKILLLPVLFYVFEYLIICYGFRWKFGGAYATRWVATLCFFPCMVGVFVPLLMGYLFSEKFAIDFIEWYSMISVTISVLIFEYKFFTHGNKQRK